jgi:hypothetical protein
LGGDIIVRGDVAASNFWEIVKDGHGQRLVAIQLGGAEDKSEPADSPTVGCNTLR